MANSSLQNWPNTIPTVHQFKSLLDEIHAGRLTQNDIKFLLEGKLICLNMLHSVNLIIEYDCSLKELITAGQYDQQIEDTYVKELEGMFPRLDHERGKRLLAFKLVSPWPNINDNRNEEKESKRLNVPSGWRCATMRELLTLGKMLPGLQRSYRIFAEHLDFKEDSRKGSTQWLVPCLWSRDNKRYFGAPSYYDHYGKNKTSLRVRILD